MFEAKCRWVVLHEYVVFALVHTTTARPVLLHIMDKVWGMNLAA